MHSVPNPPRLKAPPSISTPARSLRHARPRQSQRSNIISNKPLTSQNISAFLHHRHTSAPVARTSSAPTKWQSMFHYLQKRALSTTTITNQTTAVEDTEYHDAIDPKNLPYTAKHVHSSTQRRKDTSRNDSPLPRSVRPFLRPQADMKEIYSTLYRNPTLLIVVILMIRNCLLCFIQHAREVITSLCFKF